MELHPNGYTVAFLGFVFCIFSATGPLENTTAHLGSHLLGSSGRPCFSWADSSAETGGCMVGQVAISLPHFDLLFQDCPVSSDPHFQTSDRIPFWLCKRAHEISFSFFAVLGMEPRPPAC